MRYLFCFIVGLFMFSSSFSQESTDTTIVKDLLDMSIEDLMNVKVSVSTKSSLNIRETPSIVSLIRREDIDNSGARDIVDLIQRYVPGFEFSTEVEGIVGLAVRGIWCHEGKILLLINGMEVNETMFGTAMFSTHFPLNNIERIEIVRGPGSVIYGGYASMGVINIITKEYDNKNGNVSYLASHTCKSLSHNNLSFGHKIVVDDFKINIFADFMQGTRSDKMLYGLLGDKRTMHNNSGLKIMDGGFNVNYKNISLKTFILQHQHETIDLWDSLYQQTPPIHNNSHWISELSYKFKIKNIKISPHIFFKKQKPYNINAKEILYVNNKIADKLNLGLNGQYNKGIFNILLGCDYYYSTLRTLTNDTIEEKIANNKILYNIFSTYTQIGLDTKYANIIAGVRFDKSDLFGHAFNPRFVITKAFEKFHIKISANRAFRIPGGILPNRQPAEAESLKPEISVTHELEAGVRVIKGMYLTLNSFYTHFRDVIVHETSESIIGSYKNAGKFKVIGIESSLKYNSEKIDIDVNFAYYNRIKNNGDSTFMVPSRESYFLSLSPIKINANVSYKLINDLYLNINTSFFGDKYAYTSFNQNKLVLERIKPVMLLNFNIIYKNFTSDGFDVSIGATNLLNQNFKYYTVRKSKHSHIPALDRAFFVKLTYQY